MTVTTWYQVEEWVPESASISGKPYWSALLDTHSPTVWRTEDCVEATETVKRLLVHGRNVRLVRVTEEVLDV